MSVLRRKDCVPLTHPPSRKQSKNEFPGDQATFRCLNQNKFSVRFKQSVYLAHSVVHNMGSVQDIRGNHDIVTLTSTKSLGF